MIEAIAVFVGSVPGGLYLVIGTCCFFVVLSLAMSKQVGTMMVTTVTAALSVLIVGVCLYGSILYDASGATSWSISDKSSEREMVSLDGDLNVWSHPTLVVRVGSGSMMTVNGVVGDYDKVFGNSFEIKYDGGRFPTADEYVKTCDEYHVGQKTSSHDWKHYVIHLQEGTKSGKVNS